MTTHRSSRPPLARLFAIGYRTLIDEMHDELRTLGWTDVRPAFGFALLATREGPMTATQLATLMGSTKQAVSKLIDAMVEGGYVARRVGTDDARQRVLELTPRGQELLEAVESIYASTEAKWARAIGRAGLENIRAGLVAILTEENGTLPPVRPMW